MKRLFVFLILTTLFNSCGLLRKSDKIVEINLFKWKYKHNEQITIGIIGNSIGCGYRADNTFPCKESNNKGGVLGQFDLDNDGRLKEDGQYDPLVRGWSFQLNDYIKKKNKNNCIQNMSASGWDMRHHIADNTIQKIALRIPKPNIILIPLQINDSKLSIEEYIKNLELFVKQIRSFNMIPVLVKENSIDSIDVFGIKGINTFTKKTPERKNFYLIMNSIDSIAKSEHIGIVDFYSPTQKIIARTTIGNANTSGILWDYLHPNQAGHDLMFSIIKKWIKN